MGSPFGINTMRLDWASLIRPLKQRREPLADETSLPSLGEMRAAKALGHHRRSRDERSADSARRLAEAMSNAARTET